MALTSVHLTPYTFPSPELNNNARKKLEYVRDDLTKHNECFCYIAHSIKAEIEEIKKTVQDKTNRKLQRNAAPIKKAVVVIDEDTTMPDLQRFCDICLDRFGLIPLQIHIHRDEGHHRAKVWKPNLHAHIVWRVYNRDGRSIKLDRQDLRDIQTLAAEVLNMERGKSSDIRHVAGLSFRIEQMEKYLEELEKRIKDAEERAMEIGVGGEAIENIKQEPQRCNHCFMSGVPAFPTCRRFFIDSIDADNTCILWRGRTRCSAFTPKND